MCAAGREHRRVDERVLHHPSQLGGTLECCSRLVALSTLERRDRLHTGVAAQPLAHQTHELPAAPRNVLGALAAPRQRLVATEGGK